MSVINDREEEDFFRRWSSPPPPPPRAPPPTPPLPLLPRPKNGFVGCAGAGIAAADVVVVVVVVVAVRIETETPLANDMNGDRVDEYDGEKLSSPDTGECRSDRAVSNSNNNDNDEYDNSNDDDDDDKDDDDAFRATCDRCVATEVDREVGTVRMARTWGMKRMGSPLVGSSSGYCARY